MAIRWRESLHAAWIGLRVFGLTVLIFGAIQILLSLIVWPVVFRTHPLGFSMALSLVGFGSWVLAFITSLGDRRRRRLTTSLPEPPSEPLADHPLLENVQVLVQRSGCGSILIASSLLPLAIAFVLRLQADLRSGLTLRDIFPPMP